MSHETLLRLEDSLVVVVDIQEKLFPIMANQESVEANAGRLLDAAANLAVPVILSEQYPSGLGHTIPSLVTKAQDAQRIEKTTFSCEGCDPFLDLIEEYDRDQIILCGIETHVCVLQTALDLLEHGRQVHIAADAVSSRAPENKAFALDRLRQAGAIITCTESVLFEWIRDAKHPDFKTISKLVR